MLRRRRLWKRSREKCATRLKTKNQKKLGNVSFWQSKYAKVFQLGETYFKVLRITYFGRNDHEKSTFSLPRGKLLTSKQKNSNPPQVLTGHSPIDDPKFQLYAVRLAIACSISVDGPAASCGSDRHGDAGGFSRKRS